MRIEDYIHRYRDAFEKAQPGTYTWNGVEQALKRLQVADGMESTLIVERILMDNAEPAPHIWSHIEAELIELECANSPDGDQLEYFVRSHRSDFDLATPDLQVWEGISKSIPSTPVQLSAAMRVHWSRRLLQVAAVLALLLTGGTLGVLYQQQVAQGAFADNGMRLRDVSSEYAEVEEHYERDINTKQEQLAKFAAHPVSEEVQLDIRQMDKVMQELQSELAKVPPGNREQVVRAMIENYKAKAAILEKVLEGLEQEQHFKNSTLPSGHNSIKHENEQI